MLCWARVASTARATKASRPLLNNANPDCPGWVARCLLAFLPSTESEVWVSIIAVEYERLLLSGSVEQAARSSVSNHRLVRVVHALGRMLRILLLLDYLSEVSASEN